MRYMFDCEFFDDGKTINLISLGMVAEDGRELYACNLDARLDLAARDSWMKENVLAKLPPFGDKAWMPHRGNWACPGIRETVCSFLLHTESMGRDLLVSLDNCATWDGKKPEIWGYFSSYDWVVFCQLFGPMLSIPKQFPKYCRDLKQWSDDLGAPKFPKALVEHNALDDARWSRDLYNYLSAFAEKEKK